MGSSCSQESGFVFLPSLTSQNTASAVENFYSLVFKLLCLDPKALQRQKPRGSGRPYMHHKVPMSSSHPVHLWGEKDARRFRGHPGGLLWLSPIQVSPKGRCSGSLGYEERCCNHTDPAHLPVPPSSGL